MAPIGKIYTYPDNPRVQKVRPGGAASQAGMAKLTLP